MSNKLKYAPSPPPEPIIMDLPVSGPKKRGRKRTKKQYFTPDTDAAIKDYLATSNQDDRDEIFKTRIWYPFYKLAENLIHTFKFYYTEVDDLEDLKHEVICFLLEKLDYFKPEDRKVCDAINTLFKRRENLEIFNKKALYIYIREMTEVDTPVITKVTKKLKVLYKKLYSEYIDTGHVRI